MKKGIVLAVITQLVFPNVIKSQENYHKLSIARGLAITKLQDRLWGFQIYKGNIKQYTINFEKLKSNRWNQLNLSGGSGVLEVPNSIRKNTSSYQIDINFQHLRSVTTFDKSQIKWWVGGAVSTFVEFRVQNQFSSNNAFSYDMGTAFQIQNRLVRIFLLNNKKQLKCSFLVGTALLAAYLRPDYASSDTEVPLAVGSLNEVSIGTITSRMRWVSIPAFYRMNMNTTLDYLTSNKVGFRLQYNWHVLHAKRKLQVTSVSHQIHLGLFVKFGNNDTEQVIKLQNSKSLTLT